VTSSASTKMGTVGVVEFSTTLANMTGANIVYTLDNAASGVLNKGGTAPVNLKNTNNHTLLLGLKPSSSYTFHIEATSSTATCKSDDKKLTTGTLSGAPTVTSKITNASAVANGFIVTCTQGMGGGFGGGGDSSAFIFDADGTVVWAASAPASCSRARMDYEGVNMWMLGLNVSNTGGEMRFVSMDGQTSKTNISGLSSAHHDFTVIPGKIVAMLWSTSGTDPESNLVEMSSDGSGSPTTVFKIGSNLYAGGQSALGAGSNAYHANSILYHADDDSFTISDRNPNLFIRVSHKGAVAWQFGGSCTNAPASKCVSGSWKVNHGHHMLDDGTFLFFNNGQGGSSHVFEYKLSTSGTFSATQVKDLNTGGSSASLGDVQRLSGGNTIVTVSNTGNMTEYDSSWGTVRTMSISALGYADWRETLYGEPSR
jgi:hypothetical protein